MHIEKTYDKMVKKYGGNIIGIKRDEAKLIDGKFYDLKLYEILADEYQVFKNLQKTVAFAKKWNKVWIVLFRT